MVPQGHLFIFLQVQTLKIADSFHVGEHRFIFREIQGNCFWYIFHDLVDPFLQHQLGGKLSAVGQHQSVSGDPEVVLSRTGPHSGKGEIGDILTYCRNYQLTV